MSTSAFPLQKIRYTKTKIRWSRAPAPRIWDEYFPRRMGEKLNHDEKNKQIKNTPTKPGRKDVSPSTSDLSKQNAGGEKFGGLGKGNGTLEGNQSRGRQFTSRTQFK
ncbi:UNVERIFIED_CONTAM: hypothetical protein NCL1_34035 [Trichonephila clavipes]